MFKTKEELMKRIGKIVGWKEGTNKVMDIIFESFAERVEFYKKYRDTRFDFMTDYPADLYETYIIYAGRELYTNTKTYNDWLFDYCFGDVVDD